MGTIDFAGATAPRQLAQVLDTGYTFPTLCEASQGGILFNATTGLRLGIRTPGALFTWSPPVVEVRPTTPAQVWERQPGLFRRLVEVFRNLERIAQLPADWDSFESGRSTPAAVNEARSLVWTVAIKAAEKGVYATPYDVAPLSGGGVQLEWRGNAGTIQVEISGEGHFSYLLHRSDAPQQEAAEADDVPGQQIEVLISSVIQ